MIGKHEDLVEIVGDDNAATAVVEKYLLIERVKLPEVDENHRWGEDYIYIDQTTTFVGEGVFLEAVLDDAKKDFAMIEWLVSKSAEADAKIKDEPERVIRAAKLLAGQDANLKDKKVTWETMGGVLRLKFIDTAKMFLKEVDE